MFLQGVSRFLVLTFLASTQLQTLEGAEAVQGKNAPPHSNAPTYGKAACAIEMLTDTDGVNFNSYLREVYSSVKKRWFANMPPSIEKGQQGQNTVQFHVLQDGSVPKDSLEIVSSSEKSDFDAASMQGIREAIPFNHLPEKFSQPFIVLRLTFYYNLPIPQKPQGAEKPTGPTVLN